ncbi:MAG: TaqI-like C-terminal specificity domain-containing protein [Candidatus Tenebribacter davisii]|nr:TaqI-like C-terminal specificity domain-containing protein [Candidatus Tenebribacter davisii]
MTKKDELQTILNDRYNRENWQTLFKDLLPNVTLFSTPKEIFITEKGLADRVEKLCQLGFARLSDGNTIYIFELKLTEKVKLYKNKVEMRNLISKYIDMGTNNGVLAIFDSANEDYRLTFSAKDAYLSETEGMVVNETDKKRYTYLLGPNESCRTAAERLFDLYESKNAVTLEQLTKAFSVEKLNKQFFADYTDIYNKFTDYLDVSYDKKKKENDLEIPGEFSDYFKDKVEAREFVKKLMGRVVFIHFVQKKGWMGCPSTTTKWEKGDKEFLWNFWDSCADKEHFYSKYLTELFFNGFNTKRDNDIFELTDYRIPYLNGGLFSNDRPKTNSLDFPVELIGEFLEKLNHYNFTIDENDPFEVEVGIDPEMLGHIFENLLEDNKDKGAFYTPKVIVEYMCKESLISYLKTGLVEKQLIRDNDEKAQQQIEKFIKEHGKLEDYKLIADNKGIVDNLLKNVKVCDPAVGSGAFPMGMLKEITWARMVLENSDDIYTIKKEAIANSLYGVDIDPGAIDIARLRYWLALVVDAEFPEPLPNLDYKLMQGNSLLESFEGIDLSKVMEDKFMIETVIEKDQELLDFYNDQPAQQQIVFSDDRKNMITQLKDEYFYACDINRKNEIHAEIDKIVIDHIESCLEIYKDNLQLNIENMEKQLESQSLNKNDDAFNYIWNKSSKGKQLIAWKQELDLTGEKYRKLEELQNSNERPFFLWHLYFSEVFDNNRGFDIVIGNPPYGSILNSKIIQEYRKKFDYVKFKVDSYLLFMIKSFQLTNNTGTVICIIPNTLLNNYFLEDYRDFLLNNCSINKIVNFKRSVFEAVVHSLIIQYSAINNIKNQILLNFDIKNNYTLLPQSYFKKIPFKMFLFLNKAERQIFKKIFKESVPFSEIIDLRQAIKSGNDKKYIKKLKIDENDKPILRGRDLSKYSFYDPKLYLNYGNFLACPRDPVIFNQNHILIRETGSEITATIDVEKYYIMSSLYCGILISTKYSLYTILGLLNSKLFQYLMYKINFENTEGVFTKAKIYHYNILPIKRIINNQYFENTIISIINLKKSGSNTQHLEFQIDLNVYKLYELTYQESKMVDPNLDSVLLRFGLSKDDYESMSIEDLSRLDIAE